MTDQPEGLSGPVGVFEPIEAYARTLANLIALVENYLKEPDALPIKEVLRAAQVAVDTLETITEFSIKGLMVRLLTAVPEGDLDEHNLQDDAIKRARSEEETALWKIDLIKQVARVVALD